MSFLRRIAASRNPSCARFSLSAPNKQSRRIRRRRSNIFEEAYRAAIAIAREQGARSFGLQAALRLAKSAHREADAAAARGFLLRNEEDGRGAEG